MTILHIRASEPTRLFSSKGVSSSISWEPVGMRLESFGIGEDLKNRYFQKHCKEGICQAGLNSISRPGVKRRASVVDKLNKI